MSRAPQQLPVKMADEGVQVCVASDSAVKIVKWKVRDGAAVSSGQVLCLFEPGPGGGGPTVAPGRCRAPRAGVLRVRAGEGDTVQPGESIASLGECRHATVMKDMCAECGADLRSDDTPSAAAPAVVPMVHSVPELKVSEELAQKLGREDGERLLRDRKLVLLVDLDQTLVHTTNENIPPNLKNVSHYWLRGPGGGRWYHTRLRPGTRGFLRAAAARYELHVCTFGARQYAHAVARLLDPRGQYFSHRILSRDECFDARAKAANLGALFPCGDHMVCIIDDREDVWRHATNLIHVRPYNFFQCTGDINAPPLADEKSKLISGKNGSQVPPNPDMEMPCLDPDPDLSKERISKAAPKIDTAKGTEGSNGKVKSKTEGPNETEAEIDKEEMESDNKEKEVDEKKTEDDQKDNNADKMVTDSDTELDKKDIDPDPSYKDVEEKEDNEESKEAKKESGEPKWKETPDGLIDVEDPDDYLIYLEDILERIHTHFYEQYDAMEAGQVPDLKAVIPAVRGAVLAGTSLVFSGLVPTQQRLEGSRAYQLARGLGADVTGDLTPQTTHLLAVRPGTAKVNAARRLAAGGGGRPHVVTPEWLWACAERWERVDERLYPLQRGQTSARRPPPHCGSPPPPPAAAARRRTPSGRFMDTINPLLSFSSADIADMDREVEDIFNESDESSSDGEEGGAAAGEGAAGAEGSGAAERLAADAEDSSQDQRLREDLQDSSSNDSGESLTGEEGSRPRKRRRTSPAADGPEPPDDDSSWSLMGEALEREFLGLH